MSQNEATGLIGLGRCGDWTVSVDESLNDPARSFLQIEGRSLYFCFVIEGQHVIEELANFLNSPDGQNRQTMSESLAIGRFMGGSVTIRRDDEFTDRYFLVIGESAESTLFYTFAGDALHQFREAVCQIRDDLRQDGLISSSQTSPVP